MFRYTVIFEIEKCWSCPEVAGKVEYGNMEKNRFVGILSFYSSAQQDLILYKARYRFLTDKYKIFLLSRKPFYLLFCVKTFFGYVFNELRSVYVEIKSNMCSVISCTYSWLKNKRENGQTEVMKFPRYLSFKFFSLSRLY